MTHACINRCQFQPMLEKRGNGCLSSFVNTKQDYLAHPNTMSGWSSSRERLSCSVFGHLRKKLKHDQSKLWAWKKIVGQKRSISAFFFQKVSSHAIPVRMWAKKITTKSRNDHHNQNDTPFNNSDIPITTFWNEWILEKIEKKLMAAILVWPWLSCFWYREKHFKWAKQKESTPGPRQRHQFLIQWDRNDFRTKKRASYIPNIAVLLV